MTAKEQIDVKKRSPCSDGDDQEDIAGNSAEFSASTEL